MFTRRLTLPAPATETFFLWGPRQQIVIDEIQKVPAR
jgi:hypothetical protein